jgi:hypothetical protein
MQSSIRHRVSIIKPAAASAESRISTTKKILFALCPIKSRPPEHTAIQSSCVVILSDFNHGLLFGCARFPVYTLSDWGVVDNTYMALREILTPQLTGK